MWKLKTILLMGMCMIMINLVSADTGIQYMENESVYKIYNDVEEVYVDSTTGIQLTNHYLDYWTRNLLCVDYQTNKWNSYCTDGFPWNWETNTDNNTYARLTGTSVVAGETIKISYELNIDENANITMTFNNTGNKDITDSYLNWYVMDIKMWMNETNNFFEFHNLTGLNNFNLSEQVNRSFSNITNNTFYITVYPNDYNEYGVRMIWNDEYDYELILETFPGQTNVPINYKSHTGLIDKGESKSISLLWHDPDYYMYGYSITNSSNNIVEGNRMNLTVNVEAGNKAGDWALYVNVTNSSDFMSIVDGDCSDAGDAWKVTNLIEDGTVCITDDAESVLSEGKMWCGGDVGTVDVKFEVEACSGGAIGTPYIFYNHCVGENGGDLCDGFGDVTGEITWVGLVPSFSNGNINITGNVFEGMSINHSITITEGTIDKYLFSWNSTGSWINTSVTDVDAETVYASNLTIVPSVSGSTVAWKFCANNSVGWGCSGTYNYSVYSYGTLNVNITSPVNYYNFTQNNRFNLNATVECVGGAGAKCGTVNGLARYNLSGATPNTPINTSSGATPFYIVGGGVGGEQSILDINGTSNNGLGNELQSLQSFNNNQGSGDLTNVLALMYSADLGVEEDINVTIRLENVSAIGKPNMSSSAYIGYAVIPSFGDTNVVYRNASFSDVSLVNNTRYVIIFSSPNSDTSAYIFKYNNSDPYKDGNRSASSDSGSTWSVQNDDLAIILNISVGGAENPVDCDSLDFGDDCNVSFLVNATGVIGSSYLVDVLFNSSYGSANIPENNTEDRKVNIVSPYGTLSVNISSPVNNINVTQNNTFQLNATVSCVGVSEQQTCGTVNAYARYNFSGTSPNTNINTTIGAAPLHILGDIKLHFNYSGIEKPSTTHAAYWSDEETPFNTRDDTTNEIETGDYSKISEIPDRIFVGGYNHHAFLRNKFEIGYAVENIKEIKVVGLIKLAAGPAVYGNLSIWNGSSYVMVNGFDSPDGNYHWLNYTINLTSTPVNLLEAIGEDKTLYYALSGELYTDIIYVNYTSINVSVISNPKSVVSLDFGDDWNVSWVVNATGVNMSTYFVDVLFNSSYGSSLIAENNTLDRRVCIGSCEAGEPPAADNCSCPGAGVSKIFNLSLNCNITSSCIMNSIGFKDDGTFNINSTLNVSSFNATDLDSNDIIWINGTGKIYIR